MQEPSLTLEQYVDLYLSAHPKSKRKDVAKHLGISDAYLCQIIAKVRHPSPDVMQKIALRTGGMVPFASWSRRLFAAA